METKTIKEFPNYLISNCGKVIAISYINKRGSKEISRQLKPSKSKDGYLRVCLVNDKDKKTISIHRLVAMAFIPNPELKETVNHINGIKIDNRIENLEWSTRSEQLIHAYKLGLKKQDSKVKNKISIANGKKVECINKLTNEKSVHHSARDCSLFVGKSLRWCDKMISSQNGETYNYKLKYI